jgi:co-chaperonin GroES (HSP10)
MLDIEFDKVLIRPYSDITITDGGSAIVDNFEPQYHFSICAEVIAIPRRLRYEGDKLLSLYGKSEYTNHKRKRATQNSMEWKTNIEINVGDVVMYDYAIRLHEPFQQGLYLVDYSALYCKCDPIVPLNGYVFVEPIADNNNEPTRGIVRVIGKPNDGYLGLHHSECEDDVKINDIVLFLPYAGIQIEHKDYNTMGYNYPLLAIQRRNILGLLTY